MGLTENAATTLLALSGLDIRPNSAVSVKDAEVGLAGSGHRQAILAPSGSRVLSGLVGESSAVSGRTLPPRLMEAHNLRLVGRDGHDRRCG